MLSLTFRLPWLSRYTLTYFVLDICCSLEFLHTCLAGELKSNNLHCWSNPSTMILFIIIFDCSTSSIVDHWFATLKIFTWSWLMIFLHSPLEFFHTCLAGEPQSDNFHWWLAIRVYGSLCLCHLKSLLISFIFPTLLLDQNYQTLIFPGI